MPPARCRSTAGTATSACNSVCWMLPCRTEGDARASCRHTPGPNNKAGKAMAKLNLSVAIGDYDRTRPRIDGAVQIDGVDPVFMKLYPEEIFFRAFRNEDFDICECSLSSFSVKTAAGHC